MRLLTALAALLLIAGPAAAEFGPYDEAGWPINVDGQSTAPNNQVGPATLYPYYPILTAEVQRLASQYPDLVRLTSAGQSTLGLEMWLLEIANFAALEAGEGVPMAEREVIWLDGGTHSNEYSGVYFALAWAQFLLEEYETNETARWIVDNRHTWILPMINPDGSNLMGRLNANLVNINRNYPVIWDGEGHDAAMNNRGPSPASEVETQIVIDWWNRTQPDYMASIHCCGNLWLYPYGEAGVDPLPGDAEMLDLVCDLAFPGVREDCGPIWSTIYPASGSSVDTAYEYTGAVSFGYEMSGRGAVGLWGAPLTVESVREQEHESWGGMLHAFENVHLYGAHAVVSGVVSNGDDLQVTVANEGYGPLHGGSFEVAGKTVSLAYLAAGESVTVTVPDAASESVGALSYQKRAVNSPGTWTTATVLLDELTVNQQNNIPGFPLAAALLGLALLARRRARST